MRFWHLRACRCADSGLFCSTQASTGNFGFYNMIQCVFQRLCLIFGILLPFGLSACDSPTSANRTTSKSEVRQTETIGVKTITLKQDQIPDLIERFSGLIKPVRSSDLSFIQAGKVAEVFIDVGSAVKQGEILAQLDDEPFLKKKFNLQSQLTAAQADLNSLNQPKTGQSSEQMVAKINQLRSELDRLETEVKNSLPSSENRDNLNERLKSSEEQIQTLNQKSRQQKITGLTAQIKDLRGQLQEVDATIAACNVTAPFTGVIIDKMIDPGSVVSPGRTVLKIAKIDAYRVWVRLPAEVAETLTLGQELPIEQDQQTIFGQVTAIHPTVDALTQTRTVVLQPRDSKAANSFTAGERVDVLFPTAQQQSGFWLPVSALMKEIAGLWSVYLVETIEEKPTIVRRYVEVIDVGNDRALVLGNLREGMSVVVEGLHRIVPGQIVRHAEQKKTRLKDNKKPEQVPSL
ncbi:putative efflux pump membrane fusion protein [Gimesia aquarii]|uniref:Putative efflux pump membrane fusion protein n=1 Tax=Gimesia aquarii TaxID=2527964 RepID=A0A517W043_9PLAN|nr:putative efflux pump membrane fusion protein [Gimesia aquarii]